MLCFRHDCDPENMANELGYQEIIQQKDRRIESLEGELFTLKEQLA